MAANEERARIEAVAVMCKEVVDFFWIGNILEFLLDDVLDFYIRVGDQSVEVEPPDPVIIARLDELLSHVELPEDDGAVGVGFVLHDEVVAMAAGVVCAAGALAGRGRGLGARLTVFVLQREVEVGPLLGDEGH